MRMAFRLNVLVLGGLVSIGAICIFQFNIALIDECALVLDIGLSYRHHLFMQLFGGRNPSFNLTRHPAGFLFSKLLLFFDKNKFCRGMISKMPASTHGVVCQKCNWMGRVEYLYYSLAPTPTPERCALPTLPAPTQARGAGWVFGALPIRVWGWPHVSEAETSHHRYIKVAIRGPFHKIHQTPPRALTNRSY